MSGPTCRLIGPLLATLLVPFLAGAGARLAAQGVVVDQGRFAVTVDGRPAGSEEFSIRRAGFGTGDAFYSNGVIRLVLPEGEQEIRPLLRAAPPGGATERYQVRVTGPDALELGLQRELRRFRALIRSEGGEENREFPARPNTKTLDLDVAHQYYFLRDLREGETVHVLVPRERHQTTLRAGPWQEMELQLGANQVPARRVEYEMDGEERTVWFDRLGRVLRVEVPARGYVAERTDLVG